LHAARGALLEICRIDHKPPATKLGSFALKMWDPQNRDKNAKSRPLDFVRSQTIGAQEFIRNRSTDTNCENGYPQSKSHVKSHDDDPLGRTGADWAVSISETVK
jgi:hypothetical protein